MASICVQSISQRDVFAFQSARTRAVGINMDCSMESDTGGQVGRGVSDLCAQAAKIISSNRPDRRIAECFAFICRTAYFVTPTKTKTRERSGLFLLVKML